MRILVVADTHDLPEEELALIPQEAEKRQCDAIIHCGDLEDAHFGHPALGNLPITVIRTSQNEHLGGKILKQLPKNWHVLPDNDCQVIEFGHGRKIRIYINHYLGTDLLRSDLSIPTPEAAISESIELEKGKNDKIDFRLRFMRRFRKITKALKKGLWPKSMAYQIVDKIHQRFGEIHYILCGHSHHQFFHVSMNTAIVNPGAFGPGFDGRPKRSFAVIDTQSWDVTFCKILAKN